MARKKTTTQSKILKTDESTMQIPSPTPPVMLNTITLSSDQSTIYLIENGRVIPYSLYSIGGVLIGLVGGQLTVVSALEPQPDPGASATSSPDAAARAIATPIPHVKGVKLPTATGQWTLLFLPRNYAISIMGATDIDASIRESSDDVALDGYLFDLREGYVNIRRVGNFLVAVSMPLKA